MKKIIVLVLVLIVCAASLCACTIGNHQIGIDTTHTFAWGIIQLGNGELIEGTVTSWRDFNGEMKSNLLLMESLISLITQT